uniref:Electron transfer flavoprotein regulatory factor 1 n=1 Tax=Apteryx owenii TaxID=8824 RepID=A0A8B9PH25_APTOW
GAARGGAGPGLPLRLCRKASYQRGFTARRGAGEVLTFAPPPDLGPLSPLLYLGREYPKGADYFRSHLKAAFLKNKDVKDPEKIKQLIARGEFVIKELEALYYLRKYRAMKQRYYEDDNK